MRSDWSHALLSATEESVNFLKPTTRLCQESQRSVKMMWMRRCNLWRRVSGDNSEPLSLCQQVDKQWDGLCTQNSVEGSEHA